MNGQDFFRQRIEQAHSEVKMSLDALLDCLTTGNADYIHAKIQGFAATVTKLSDLLPPGGKPGWLNTLETQLARHARRNPKEQGASLDLMTAVASAYSKLRNENWERLGEIDQGIDFDAAFAARFDASRATELFEKLVLALEQLAASELIDSRQVIRELERLVATLKRSLKGSQFAKWWAWRFAQKFFKHAAWEAVESVPGLSQLVRAARAAVQELNEEMDKVEEAVKQDIQPKIESSVAALDQLPKGLPAPGRVN